MALRIRRGTELQRQSITFDQGELAWTTDSSQLFIGDGVTQGGVHILANSAGGGLIWNSGTQKLDINPANLGFTTTNVLEGTRKYYTSQRAQDDVYAMISSGSHTGISFAYDGTAHSLSATVTGGGGGGSGIANVHADTSPALGGNLDLSTHNIVGTGNINISGSVTANTFVGNLNGSLAGNLGLSSRSITGSGSINITGAITGTSVTGTTASLANISFATETITSQSSQLDFGTVTTGQDLRVFGLVTQNTTTDGTAAGSQYLTLAASKGTLSSPLTLGENQYGSGFKFAIYDGSSYTAKGFVIGGTDYSTQHNPLPGKISFAIHDASGNYTLGATITSRKLVQSYGFIATAYATVAARDAALTDTVDPTPTPGTIVFVTDSDGSGTPAFMGYNGSAWITLG